MLKGKDGRQSKKIEKVGGKAKKEKAVPRNHPMTNTYCKSSNRSRPLIQVYSIRGRALKAPTAPRKYKNHIF